MTFGTSKVTSKGQVTIPAEIRKNLGLEDGTNVVFLELEDGVLIKSEKNIREALGPFDERSKTLKLTKKDLEREVREERKKRGSKNA
ncbi:MAG: AbrB/MazE/SpoVT family DNA-binding domain-containing protein [Candidatus Thermoplasmatota archaeon]|nr:AbrB/MazE/SpoVT family DNA-binding domain-containing protein [Candidatus Thermoplasmatota archaeon]MBU4072184.1 AbrB/MazE/SpoVT family DNA-binding domain-containing protein [Candidatus Thermoplasmatota archaeon]MBU4145014.1 AbrB/MazE/SpoVT family DNA-binding domain-containing protein [Candidatus Thermoplasmatota archaeon]MBU4592028.1 AbrB/MazE/SpoVT family DNA-binding domain-containing protein [Candidatus Thermoplasmatota archaeon]